MAVFPSVPFKKTERKNDFVASIRKKNGIFVTFTAVLFMVYEYVWHTKEIWSADIQNNGRSATYILIRVVVLVIIFLRIKES